MPSLGGKIINERWQAEKRTVLERNKFMFGNELMSDIKFAFPPNNERTTPVIIPAHKYVLATSSPVFLRELGERQDDTFEITDYDPEVFRCFLGFIYCDEATFLDVDFAIKVWRLAVKYDVPSLVSECVMFIEGSMDHASAFRVIPYARQFSNESLEMVCWEILDYNARELVSGDSFLDLSHEFLVSFLERSSLCIDEITLFTAVNRWATNRCKENGEAVNGTNKRTALGDDLPGKIRFTAMTAKQFSEIVLPEEILTKDEVIDVYKAFYSNYSNCEPACFKFSILPRTTGDETVCSCRLSNHRLKIIDQQYAEHINESKMLTFVTDESILFCGLQFLFDTQATSGWVSLTLWRQGKKMKKITARSVANQSWQTNQYGSNMVFFNRPVCVDKNTCYTVELQGQSSCSDEYRVINESSAFVQWPAGCSTHSNICSNTNEVEFRFCEGLFSNEIPEDRPYIGHIEYLLFHNKPFRYN